MSAPTNQPPDRVLATLNADGSRRWLRPRLSGGRFLTARRAVAYALIVLFTVVPYLSIGGTPLLRLDIANRRFAFFGHTFLPTDTALMALVFMCIFFSIFLVTALFGRVWCGWACPQTVYMEFVYRPIERLFEGGPGRKRLVGGPAGVRKAAKYATYFLVSLFLAHTFLAYFVDPRDLVRWVVGSPFDHPAAFLIVAATTALMMFDFCFFREQTCLVACPYGRIQAAMLDRHSLIVTYDERRGEPRGKPKRRRAAEAEPADVSLKVVPDNGDCIDCTLCVQTCPTGIDIRDGLQMECIGCAQCIDACDAVMEKIGKPRGLIRYSSQAILDGKAKSIVRPRLFVYPTLLVVLAFVFVLLLTGRQVAEVRVLPRQGTPYYAMPDGLVGNQTRLRVVNRSDAPATYTVTAAGHPGIRVATKDASITLEPNESSELGFIVVAPPDIFYGSGGFDAELTVTDGAEFSKTVHYRMLGPGSKPREPEQTGESP